MINVKRFTQIQLDLEAVTPEDVICSYTGRSHRCRCGCSGTYKYTEAGRADASKRRGYEVSDDDVSERSVTRTLNRLKEQHRLFPVSITEGMRGEIIVDAQIDGRDVTVYLRSN